MLRCQVAFFGLSRCLQLCPQPSPKGLPHQAGRKQCKDPRYHQRPKVHADHRHSVSLDIALARHVNAVGQHDQGEEREPVNPAVVIAVDEQGGEDDHEHHPYPYPAPQAVRWRAFCTVKHHAANEQRGDRGRCVSRYDGCPGVGAHPVN